MESLKLKIAYNDKHQLFIDELSKLCKNYDNLILEIYNEQVYKQNKKALMLKAAWGTKISPFAVLENENSYLHVFYSENKTCNIDYIKNILNDIYENKSNK